MNDMNLQGTTNTTTHPEDKRYIENLRILHTYTFDTKDLLHAKTKRKCKPISVTLWMGSATVQISHLLVYERVL